MFLDLLQHLYFLEVFFILETVFECVVYHQVRYVSSIVAIDLLFVLWMWNMLSHNFFDYIKLFPNISVNYVNHYPYIMLLIND